MAIIYTGASEAVSQVVTIVVGSNTDSQTFSISVANPRYTTTGGAISIASYTASSDSTADIAQELYSDWIASNHPWARAVTASVSNSTITFTANRGGVPFILTTGGTGTLTKTTTTANSGPFDMAVPGNYSGGALPAANADLHIQGNVSLLYGLDYLNEQSIDLDQVHFIGFSGVCGTFDAPFIIDIEESLTVDATGPIHMTVYTEAGAPTIDVYNTAPQSPAGLYIEGTSGGLHNGLGATRFYAGRTQFRNSGGSTNLMSISPGAFVHIAPNVGFNVIHNNGGILLHEGTGTMATFTQSNDSAETTTLGNGAITAATINAGKFIPNSTGTVATANLNGGHTDATQSRQAREFTTVNQDQAAIFDFDDDYVTVGTHNRAGPMRVAGFGALAKTRR